MAMETAPKSAGGEKSGAGKTVLVADDDELILTLARRILDQGGHEALLAEGGRQAIELFEQHADRIDVVLLDMTMPDVDGAEVAKAIKARKPDARIVIASGYLEHEVQERIAELGLAGFLQKPFGAAELLAAIQQA